MKTRVITGALFGIVFLTVIALGGIPFVLLCGVATSIGVYEYARMSVNKPKSTLNTLLAVCYIMAGFLCFFTLRENEGLTFILYLLIVIWATDSFAYVTGVKFGKTKLAPKISPNKTWEGSIGGTVIATILAVIFYLMYQPLEVNLLVFIGITILLSIAGQIGDLIESFVKRYYGIKDSGKILPGHGGILDRFDSLMLVSIVAYFII